MSYLNRLAAVLFVLLSSFSVTHLQAFEGKFNQTMSLEGKTVAQFKVTTKGESVRMEILNGQEPEMVLENAEGYFRVYPNKKLAIQMPKMDRKTFLDDMGNFDAYLKENEGSKQGEEKIGENDTEIFQYTDPMSKQKGQAWVLKDKRLPVKIEVPTPQGTLKVEFTDFNVTDPVDDSAFAVPEGVKVISHEQIMAKYAEAQKKQAEAEAAAAPAQAQLPAQS